MRYYIFIESTTGSWLSSRYGWHTASLVNRWLMVQNREESIILPCVSVGIGKGLYSNNCTCKVFARDYSLNTNQAVFYTNILYINNYKFLVYDEECNPVVSSEEGSLMTIVNMIQEKGDLFGTE